MTFKQKMKYASTALVAAALSTQALAQSAGVDVTATVTELGTVKTAVLAIGVAVLSIAIGIKLYKWVKAAL
jgi:transcription elongation factor